VAGTASGTFRMRNAHRAASILMFMKLKHKNLNGKKKIKEKIYI
jgi:hypothetical protein